MNVNLLTECERKVLWEVGHHAIARYGREGAQLILDVNDAVMDRIMATFEGTPGTKRVEEDHTLKQLARLRKNLARTRAAFN